MNGIVPMSRNVGACVPALLALVVLGGAGCAHQKMPVAPADASRAELARLRVQLTERDQTIQQLEGRLALLEAAQRQLRAELEATRALAPAPVSAAPASIRIGARKSPPEPEPPVEVEPEPRAAPRPVLRLHAERGESGTVTRGDSGTVTRAEPRELTSAFQPSPSERLTVAPVPAMPLTPVRSVRAGTDDAAQERYVHALDLVRRREFAEALRELDAFLYSFPTDPRCAWALFWRGEILFAERSYARALAAFEDALKRAPAGEKAPDALLRIARCQLRLGAPALARAALARLRAEFPDSDAARSAEQVMQEDS